MSVGGMIDMVRIKYSPLYMEAKTELIKMLKKGDFKNNKLPPEDKLSELLGISRSTIINGKIIMENGKILTIDEESLTRIGIKKGEEILRRIDFDKT